MEMCKRKAAIPGFDYLKIICSILIVFHHYQQRFECHFKYINFFDGAFYFGYLVELFFMISGFLTVYTMRKEKVYYAFFHKLVRLYPISLISVLVALILKSLFKMITNDTE